MSKKKKQRQRAFAGSVRKVTHAAGQVFAPEVQAAVIAFRLPVQGGWMVTRLDGVMLEGSLKSGALLHFERLAGKELETAAVAMNLEQPTILAPLPEGAKSPNLAVRVLKEVLKRGYKVA